MNTTENPVRTITPSVAPGEEPLRRLAPDEICPNQKAGVTTEIRRVI